MTGPITSPPLAGKWASYPAYKESGVEWLGQIPAHWKVQRLKHVCRRSALYGANEPAAGYLEEGVRFLRTTDINDSGRLNSQGAIYLDRSSVAEYLLEEGDLLLSRSGTIGRSFVYRTKLHGECAYAGYLVRFTPTDALMSDFAFYFTKSRNFVDWLSVSVIESTIGNVNGQKYANMFLPVPPSIEQQPIAAFLDRETAKIDASIAKKERLIGLLREKRTALITQAVTKGLDPNVPMKDSGVEWFGRVPAYWQIQQLRRIVRTFVDYRGKTPAKVPVGIPLVTAGNVKNGEIDFGESEEFIAEDAYGGWMIRGFPERGDVIVTTEAPLGEAAQIENARVALAQRLILLKTKPEHMTNEFLKYHFAADSGKGELWSRATGSTAVGIKASHLKATLVTVPPLHEQNVISRHLDVESQKIDAITAEIREGIERLKEYRTTLISAAVTGKIDVRDEAA